MKKVISTVAALAMAGVMATSAFAAASGKTAAELQAIAAPYASTASAYGVNLNDMIASLSNPEAVDVDAVKATVVELKATMDKVPDADTATAAINKAAAAIKTATADQVVLSGVVNAASNKITVTATVGGKTFKATAEDLVYTGVGADGKGTTSGTGTSTSTNGVIKATGLNTTGVAAAALAVASVLGVAAVKARKQGE